MTGAAVPQAPRTAVFNAVCAGLIAVSLLGVLLILATPPGPQDMMVPWMRPVGLLQPMVGAACVGLVWSRKAWAFYVYVGLVLIGVLLGVVLQYPLLMLLVGPVCLGLLLWGLHSGGVHSMWRQLFGVPGMPGRGMAYGPGPAMPPPMPGAGPAPMPPSAARVAPPPPLPPAPAPAAAAPAALEPLEALKRLGALRESGAITEAEFAAKKAEILSRL